MTAAVRQSARLLRQARTSTTSIDASSPGRPGGIVPFERAVMFRRLSQCAFAVRGAIPRRFHRRSTFAFTSSDISMRSGQRRVTTQSPAQGNLTTSTVNEDSFATTGDSGSTFRWDASGQQYIYNWNTASTQGGYYWKIGVKLDDGQTYYTEIGLRK